MLNKSENQRQEAGFTGEAMSSGLIIRLEIQIERSSRHLFILIEYSGKLSGLELQLNQGSSNIRMAIAFTDENF